MVSRLVNQVRCWGSYALSAVGMQRVAHMPAFVSVEPANFCQLRCPECPVGMASTDSRRPRRTMSMELFRNILNDIRAHAHTMQFYFQGEPLLNRQLPEMIRLAHDEGIYTIVSTNAQALDQPMAIALVQAGLNRIIVSMDGYSQQTYEQYRVGGSVQKAKDAIRYLREARAHAPLTAHRLPMIELQCLMLSTNEAEWETLRREYKQLGADRLTYKTAQLYDFEHGNPLMPADSRYARYRYDAKHGKYVLKRRLHNRCLRLWSGCVIDADGNVLPCCYDKSEQFVLGNIREQSLRQIWHGAKAREFRRAVMTRRAQINICTNCDE